MNTNNFEKKKLKIINLFKEKKYSNLITLGLKLYKTNPNDPQLLYILGLTNINIKNFKDAEIYFKNLVSIKNTSEIHYTYGNIQKKLKKYDEAIVSFEKAISLNPKFSEAYNNLGNTYKLINKRVEAITNLKKAISFKSTNIEALFNLSTILKENNEYKELILIYKKILELDKNNIKTLYNLGSTYLFLGDIKKGRECFEKIFKIDANYIPSLRNYISITKIESNNHIFNHLKNIDIKTLDKNSIILLYDAMSKGYFDQNESESGFKYLTKSNLLKKEETQFSFSEEKKIISKIKTFFKNLDNFKPKFPDTIESKPIFIVGMPRSGTSLIEQILSTHSQIYGAGELNYFQKAINSVGLEIPKNAQNYFGQIRKVYYEQLSKISKSPYIIDKLPLNFKWLGFIINSFPEAKIIHIERNPMAVCWSNYKTNFVDSGMGFSLTQEDTAHYYSIYIDLINFWFSKFRHKILNVKYENFVKDYENNSKEIINHIGLTWESKILQYEKNYRAVSTASYQQVRGKIKKDTSKQWEKYSKYLDKMMEVLKNNKIEF